jgi:protein-S-isoprenylcysteine O-methyltransferase Ste14
VTLLLKNLIYSLVFPGLLLGWFPLRVFDGGAVWPVRIGALQYAGAAFVVAGFVLYAWCVWHLARRGRGTPAPFDPPRKLVQRGPYRWLRNPCYLAVLLAVGGEALFLLSWHVAIYWVCLACALQLLVMLHEEPAMSFRYGAMYEDYCRTVPRWRPRRPRDHMAEHPAGSRER